MGQKPASKPVTEVVITEYACCENSTTVPGHKKDEEKSMS